MAASGEDRPLPTLTSASVQFQYVLVGNDIGIQLACNKLDWVGYACPERESARQGQGRVQQLLRSGETHLMLVVVPLVRQHTNHIKSLGHRVKEFCRIVRDSNVPRAIFTCPVSRGGWTHDIRSDLEDAFEIEA